MPHKDITVKRAYDRAYWRKVKGDGPPATAARHNLMLGEVQKLAVPGSAHGLRIAYVPDVQAMPGVPLDHLTWYGQYIADKRPDVIVCGGDFGDFPSLSQFGIGTMEFEGRRYMKDLAAFHEAMQLFLEPIEAAAGYKPVKVFTTGNHEDHINRAVQQDAKLEGLMSQEDLCLEEYGWKVYPFLQPVSIGGVAFCHYYPSGVMGRPITTASALMAKLHMSAVAGHQQGREIHFGRRADGGHMTTIISGSFYQHRYKYLSPFTNAHWRGAWFLHQVKDGEFDEMALSIDFLKRRYG